MAIPIVFPFRQNTAKWEELKYAIRSFETNFKDDYEIWIIGPKPKWFIDGNIIQFDWFKFRGGHTKNKNCNINNKFLLASNLFKEFIWVADDQYLIKPSKLIDFKKSWVLENIKNIELPKKPTPWQRLLIHTYQYGIKEGYDIHYNFESHMPLYVQSEYVPEVSYRFPIASGDMLFKQAYGMVRQSYVSSSPLPIVSAYEERLGIYTNTPIPKSGWSGKRILNFDDKGLLSPGLKERIQIMFPVKSSFERKQIPNKKKRRL